MKTLEKIREKVYAAKGTYYEPPKIFFDSHLDTKTDEAGVKKCVYRLWYSDKYIIWYGVTLWGSYFHFKRGFKNWDRTMDVFHKRIYQHIEDHPDREFKIELLFESEDDYQILKFHQAQLDKNLRHEKDQNCLNTDDWAYLPVRNKETTRYGSFSDNAGRAYLRWIKSERYLKARTGY